MTKFVDRLIRLVEWVALTMLGVAVVFIIMQVFTRYVLRSPLGWTEQAARYLFIWFVMLGIPIMFQHHITLAFDLLCEKFPPKVHFVVDIVMKLLTCVFCAYYFRYSLELCIRTGKRLASGIQIPMVWIYAAQPVAAALLFLVVLSQMIDLIRNRRHGGEKA